MFIVVKTRKILQAILKFVHDAMEVVVYCNTTIIWMAYAFNGEGYVLLAFMAVLKNFLILFPAILKYIS